MLAKQLKHIDFLDETIAELDKEVKARMLSFEEDLELLDTIPGAIGYNTWSRNTYS